MRTKFKYITIAISFGLPKNRKILMSGDHINSKRDLTISVKALMIDRYPRILNNQVIFFN